MLKSMKMVKVLSQLTEEYPHGCNVGKYLMVESWRKLWLHFKLQQISFSGMVTVCRLSERNLKNSLTDKVRFRAL